MPTAPAQPPARIKVLVVDDSALVREAITAALSRDPAIDVVGTACDPYVAREKILRLDPDVLTLDIEMPRMDGLTFLRILMKHHPLPVVVVSSLAQQGSRAALEALEAGAVDVLAKPNGTMSVGDLAGRLAYHVKAAAAAGSGLAARRRLSAGNAAALPTATAPVSTNDPRQLVVIGASAGGVQALRQVLPGVPTGLPPIAVVQHISAYFSRVVAERLDALSALEVREATDGGLVRSGTCVIAPGDFHLAVEYVGGAFRTKLLKTPPSTTADRPSTCSSGRRRRPAAAGWWRRCSRAWAATGPSAWGRSGRRAASRSPSTSRPAWSTACRGRRSNSAWSTRWCRSGGWRPR